MLKRALIAKVHKVATQKNRRITNLEARLARLTESFEDELARVDKRLRETKVSALAWKDYGLHQQWCATCGESVEDCDAGSDLSARAQYLDKT
jgi:hypothetical protein